jgi:hypothetical protein
MFLGLPDADPLVRDMDPDPDQAKIARKPLIPSVFGDFFMTFYF